MRWILAAFYALAGWAHLTDPAPFLSIMPHAVPAAEAVVFWTGIAEILGAIALVQPWSEKLRRWGGIGLALYALCVFPANINHFVMDMAREDSGLGLAYHLPRMVAQPILIWLALWVGGVTDWPRRRPT
nr:DoxX family protein [Qipengyuania intermedia]